MAGKHRRKERDESLVHHLARGASYACAAKASGCSTRTVQRLMAEPEFREQIKKYRAAMFTKATERLTTLADDAIETLGQLLTGDNTGMVRMQSAKALLELCLRFRESLTLEERIQRLERLASSAVSGEGNGQ